MATDPSPPQVGLGTLSAAERTKQRNEAAAELVKALLIINGGGAVALLAFLQAVWVSSRALAKPTVVAIAFFSLGALLAAAFHLFRHEASLRYQFGAAKDGAKWDRFYTTAAWLSLLAFIIGVGVVLSGVLASL